MHVPFVEFQDVLRSNAVMGIAMKCLGTSCGWELWGVIDAFVGREEVV